MEFTVPADHRLKLKESEKKYMSLDITSELKKLWNMNLTMIPIGVGALDTVTKELMQWQEDLEITGEWRISKLQHY